MREYLRSIPFFSNLDDAALDTLARRLQHRHVHKGASVFLPGDGMYIIRRGMNNIIASNVISTLQDRSRWQRGQIAKGASSLVDIMLNEREIMEGEIIRLRMYPVDVVIQPDVARFHVRQYDQAQEITKAGAEAARLQIPYIRKLLAPRPRKLQND